jgi:hypothetical protein
MEATTTKWLKKRLRTYRARKRTAPLDAWPGNGMAEISYLRDVDPGVRPIFGQLAGAADRIKNANGCQYPLTVRGNLRQIISSR